MPPAEAALEATRRRFRPILMTSTAFILGVVPLLTATDAGSASQQSLGTVVFGGMLASTLLAISFVPVFFVVIRHVRRAETAGTGAVGAARASCGLIVRTGAALGRHERLTPLARGTRTAHAVITTPCVREKVDSELVR